MQQTWTDGYVTDIEYTHGFYRELTPELLRFVGIIKSLRLPPAGTPLNYCELGCGQGLTANIVAAANPHVSVYANDFNPTQIAGAKALAAEAGTPNVAFYDHSFEEFLADPSLPDQFDIIAFHGIYSWISAENRAHIVNFIRRKLKVGGLVYVSYNALPGWAHAMPLRRLLIDHAAQGGGPITARAKGGIDLLGRMVEAKASYVTQNPSLASRIERMKSQSPNYLAHEYLNRDWTPFYFSDVAAELSGAKLSYLGSAHLMDHIDAVNLSAEQQQILAEVQDPGRRETMRDFMVNQVFRRDVYVKGPVYRDAHSAREAWLDMRFALSLRREDVPMTVRGMLGEATLQNDTYDPILDALAQGPVTLRQMAQDPKIADLGWAKLMQGLTILVGAGHLQPALPHKDEAKRAQRTKALNAAICERARASAELNFLASPVTGGAIPVDRFTQLFIRALETKEKDPVHYVWKILTEVDQKIVKDGKLLETEEENIEELKARFENFSTKGAPVLKRLGIF